MSQADLTEGTVSWGKAARSRPNSVRPVLALIAMVSCNIGLFTISWDRFGNFAIESFNVKTSILAFGVSFIFALASKRFERSDLRNPLIWNMLAVVAALAIASLFARDSRAGILSTLTVVAGALIPALAVLANSGPKRLQDMLRWFVWGALFSCIFGLYQLVAYYLGIPQLIQYSGKSGGLGRISSFSYEPAYFGYFLLLALAAALVRLYVTGGSKWLYSQLALLALTLMLLNSRAAFLTIPLFLLLIWPVARGLIPARRIWIGIGSVAVIFALVCAVIPSIPVTLFSQFLSIFNPHEASSNAPRLRVFGAAWAIVRDHLWLGVGPSNFGLYLSDPNYAHVDGLPLNKMVANNIWLQALMDGGLVLTAIQFALLLLVVARVYFSGNNIARILASGWMSVVLVGGMVVSNFYDAKLWVVLALAIVVLRNRDDLPVSAAQPEAGHDPDIVIPIRPISAKHLLRKGTGPATSQPMEPSPSSD